MFKPGEVIGSYRLSHIIGSGNSASVFLAQHLYQHSLNVAIKIRARTQGQHETILAQRFSESARLQFQFCHPNIAWLYETIETDEFQALVIEYLPGGTLSNYLYKRNTYIDLEQACLLGVYLADGLEHMHDIQVIHRDIKPDNILFEDPQLIGSVRIADFDVSKNPYTSPNLTEKGAHVGTLCYTAPEQFNQEKPRAIADVYSLGMVLYEVIARRLPFDSLSAPAVFSRFLDDAPLPLLSQFVPTVSPGLDWIIEKSITTKSEERIPSAATLASLLLAVSPYAFSHFQRTKIIRLQTHLNWLKENIYLTSSDVQRELVSGLKNIGLNL